MSVSVLNGDGTLSSYNHTGSASDPDAKVMLRLEALAFATLIPRRFLKLMKIRRIIVKTSDGKQYGMGAFENVWLSSK